MTSFLKRMDWLACLGAASVLSMGIAEGIGDGGGKRGSETTLSKVLRK
jgi:hypothetical protein